MRLLRKGTFLPSQAPFATKREVKLYTKFIPRLPTERISSVRTVSSLRIYIRGGLEANITVYDMYMSNAHCSLYRVHLSTTVTEWVLANHK